MNKKVVFLPYDMDTALGINNEGALVFSYNLEDIDQISGEDVFNGQQSVLWNNLRDMFGTELRTMYQQLRSSGDLSYDKVEQAFEEHQAKWPEAVFNEDAFFKYIQPLIDEGDGSYLSMLQGSKAEQRKWWLYNRFKYVDSKYNCGDALTDYIQLRGYAKSNITVRPFADIYVGIKWGSMLRQQRAARNNNAVMVCPLDNVNDTEIYIYSASQLSSVGDLSGLRVGFADFHNAVKLQELILGSTASGYSNGNLRSINVGNLTLLRKIDARNCVGLGTYVDQKSVDLSGCSGIEEVYFDGTSIAGVVLPNGGFLKKLHLPGTITNLTIQNQTGITEFVCPDFSHVSTLNLENTGNTLNIGNIVDALPYIEVEPDGTENPASLKWYEESNNSYVKTFDTSVDVNKTYYTRGTRIRLFNYYWEFQTVAAVHAFLDKFDGMTGMDQNGNNTSIAQIFATIHLPAVTGDEIDGILARYPDIIVEADVATYNLHYYNKDGTVLLHTETLQSGQNGSWAEQPAQAPTGRYSYTFVGWSLSKNATDNDTSALLNVTRNRNVYAAYTVTERTYTVRFLNSNNAVLATVTNVAYGATVTYSGNTPTHPTDSTNMAFTGWLPDGTNITDDTDCVAQYRDTRVPMILFLSDQLIEYISDTATEIGTSAFYGSQNLEIARFSASSVKNLAFASCPKLKTVDLTLSHGTVTFESANCFNLSYAFEDLIIRSDTFIGAIPTNLLKKALFATTWGKIYVPDNLVNTYKTESSWSPYSKRIYPLSSYPITDTSTINLSWTQIKAAIDDESFFSSGYAVGDIKKIEFVGVQGGIRPEAYAEIRKIDTVNKFVDFIVINNFSGSGFTPSSTMLKYSESNVKTVLDTYYNTHMPSDLKSAITPVTKAYYCYDDTTEYVTAPLWVLNSFDISGALSSNDVNTYVKESEGEIYFTSLNEMMRYNTSTNYTEDELWWLGTAHNSTRALRINSSGIASTIPYMSGLIIYGFRIQKAN